MLAEGIQIKAPYETPIYLQSLYQKKIAFGNEGYPFKLNKNYENLNYSKGICPTAEKLQNKEFIWTQMCRPPLNKSHIDCFINACNKVQDNINLLLKYQDQFCAKTCK